MSAPSIPSVKVWDGSTTMAVKPASTAAAATDPAGVFALSPNSPLPAGTNSIGKTTNDAGSQADGHSATLGATTDLSSATTVVGLLKKLVSLLPAALVGGRLDANLGAWLGSTAPTVGQKTAASSIPVVLASDVTVGATPTASATSSVTQVASAATSAQLLAANSSRLGMSVYNDSAQVLYLKLGTTASTTSYTVQVPAQGYWELPVRYTGRIDGIWASASGNAYVTELT